MKKVFQVLSIFLVLVTMAFSFMGCDEINEIAPDNTWCELPVSVSNDSEPNLYLEIIYCPEDYTGTAGSKNLDKDITLRAGITVLAFADVEISSLGMSAGTYTYKTFPINATENDADDNDSYSFAGTKSKFTTIYLAKSNLRNSDTQITLPSAPTPICNSNGNYTKLGDFSKFSWKQILANYILNNL